MPEAFLLVPIRRRLSGRDEDGMSWAMHPILDGAIPDAIGVPMGSYDPVTPEPFVFAFGV